MELAQMQQIGAVTSTRTGNARRPIMASMDVPGVVNHLSPYAKRPRYLRNVVWTNNAHPFSSTAMSTEAELPVPSIPLSELNNPVITKSIAENPDIFKITTSINVNHFEELLANHPNQPFVRSVCKGLREGFWPWADTQIGIYPDMWDESNVPNTPAEVLFIRAQRDIKIDKGRFSESFGPDVLPSMYSMPLHVVPKPHFDDL